jgi:hypothetical protein
MRHVYAILSALLPWSVGAADAPLSDLEAKLDAAEYLWSSVGSRDHSYTLVTGGVPFGSATTYRVTVREGDCSAKAQKRVRSNWQRVDCEGISMSDVFAELRRQIAACPTAKVEIEFHERFGYIEELFFDASTDVSDDWWSLGISRFRARREPRTEAK